MVLGIRTIQCTLRLNFLILIKIDLALQNLTKSRLNGITFLSIFIVHVATQSTLALLSSTILIAIVCFEELSIQ